MKRPGVITTLILALMLAVPASANDHRRPGDRYDNGRDRHEGARARGRVIHVQPIWPQVQCRPAAHSGSSSRNGARITGALVGGTLGHLVGREHDQALLGTLAGVVIGASGAEVIVRSQQRGRPAPLCTRPESEVSSLAHRLPGAISLPGPDLHDPDAHPSGALYRIESKAAQKRLRAWRAAGAHEYGG